MNEEIKEVLNSHPNIREILIDIKSIDKLGGLTNHNHLIETKRGKFVLRLPGKGTHEYINRAHEKHAACLTAELGANAPLLYFDETTGIQITRFIENSVTMNAERFRDFGSIDRAAKTLKRVHESNHLFQTQFELFPVMDKYVSYLESKKVSLPEGFFEVKGKAQRVREALSFHKVALVPCHCDPLAENFIDTGSHMYVVDWEYAGNNDPMWDLGDLSVEAQFSEAQDDQFLKSYFCEKEIDPFDKGRMILYKAMCDLLWTLWGTIQHAQKNPVADFWAYAVSRLQRSQELMQSPQFKESLTAVEKGPSRLKYV